MTVHDFKPSFGTCQVLTECINGRWYKGSRFEVTGDRGSYSHPTQYGKAYDTERDAIDAELDSLISYSIGLPKVIESLKQCKMNNKQLTLF